MDRSDLVKALGAVHERHELAYRLTSDSVDAAYERAIIDVCAELITELGGDPGEYTYERQEARRRSGA